MVTKAKVSKCPLCDSAGPARELYCSEVMRVVRCTSCGLMYQDPRVQEAEIGDPYEVFPEYGLYQESGYGNAKKALYTARIAALRRTCGLRGHGNFLDIGASYGTMMECVRAELGWDTVGVEPSAIARQAAQGVGLRVFKALSELPDGVRFDWINLDNTLEHLENPAGTLESLRTRLTDGGFLYVEVPNEAFFQVRYRMYDFVRGEKKAPTLPGHLTLFTRATLREALHRAGYRARVWRESVSVPNRMSGVCNQREADFRWILRFLRVTKADHLVGMSYFLCAIARPFGSGIH